MINNRGFREFVVPLSKWFVLEVTCSFPKYTINYFLYSNHTIVILWRFGEQRVISSPVVHLQRRAIVYVRKSGFCTSYCFRIKITSMEQHQEYLNKLCRVCGRYSRSQRNREPVYKCSEYSSAWAQQGIWDQHCQLPGYCPSIKFLQAMLYCCTYIHETLKWRKGLQVLKFRLGTTLGRQVHAVLVSMWNRFNWVEGQRRKLDLEDHQSKISTLLSATWSVLPLVPYTSIMPTVLDKQLSKWMQNVHYA